MRRLVIGTALSVLLLAGCSAGDDGTDATASGGPRSAAPSTSTAGPADSLLAAYGLAGKSTVEVIDHLDRLGGAQRPADLTASVRPGELQLARGTQQASLDVPDDRFYLSVAPYARRTHECFFHSLTTCQGELTGAKMQVKIVDETNDKVLVDETRTTFANGFVGFWLPRGIEGTLQVSYDGMTGKTTIATDEDAPTCLTTLRLT